ncbi:MAG TPA: hypothetical protein DIU35_00900 [Candidatus Latescibacteria bacterium]|nr:hypothetical protein [Gemmatimonadota bacterium]HCR16013.1 hypothetical protein [Candidatus Latescibacterota bacterium]
MGGIHLAAYFCGRFRHNRRGFASTYGNHTPKGGEHACPRYLHSATQKYERRSTIHSRIETPDPFSRIKGGTVGKEGDELDYRVRKGRFYARE